MTGLHTSTSSKAIAASGVKMGDDTRYVQPLLINTEAWGGGGVPEAGTVIRCENGHDFGIIQSRTGGGFDGAWPVIKPDITGHVIPIHCSKCGGLVIAWGSA